MSSTKSGGPQLKTYSRRSSQSIACSRSPSFPYFSNVSNAHLCLRTKERDKLTSCPWCVAFLCVPPWRKQTLLRGLSLGEQASVFLSLLSRHSRWTEGPWGRSTRGPGNLLQNLRPTGSELVSQEMTSGGDPEVLKLSLERETGGGTVGVTH